MDQRPADRGVGGSWILTQETGRSEIRPARRGKQTREYVSDAEGILIRPIALLWFLLNQGPINEWLTWQERRLGLGSYSFWQV